MTLWPSDEASMARDSLQNRIWQTSRICGFSCSSSGPIALSRKQKHGFSHTIPWLTTRSTTAIIAPTSLLCFSCLSCWRFSALSHSRFFAPSYTSYHAKERTEQVWAGLSKNWHLETKRHEFSSIRVEAETFDLSAVTHSPASVQQSDGEELHFKSSGRLWEGEKRIRTSRVHCSRRKLRQFRGYSDRRYPFSIYIPETLGCLSIRQVPGICQNRRLNETMNRFFFRILSCSCCDCESLHTESVRSTAIIRDQMGIELIVIDFAKEARLTLPFIQHTRKTRKQAWISSTCLRETLGKLSPIPVLLVNVDWSLHVLISVSSVSTWQDL